MRSILRLGVLAISMVVAAAGLACAEERDAAAASKPVEKQTLNERILAALASPIAFSLDNIALEDIAPLVRRNYKIPVYVDRKSLDEAAISLTETIQCDGNIDDLDLGTVLDLVLRPLDLTCMPRGDVLWITSEAHADTLLDTRIYDVTELIYDGEREILTELVQCTVAPATWSEVGGPCALKWYLPGESALLVISQTYRVHCEIQTLLDSLRVYAKRTDRTEHAAAPARPEHRDEHVAAVPKMPEALLSAQRQFSVDLLHADGTDATNKLFSPIDIMTTLAPLGAGARGQTSSELALVLHLPAGFDDVVELFGPTRRLFASLNNGKSTTLRSLAGCWIRSGLIPEKEFLQTVAALGSEVKEMPLDGRAARDAINRWVAEATDGKISQLIVDPLDRDTPLVLASALYFRGDWKNRFPKANTHRAPFHVGHMDIGVHMMSMLETLPHATVDDVEIIEKPLAGDDLSMAFLLPSPDAVGPFKELEALAALEHLVTPQKLERWLGACKQETVDVRIPKFKISARIDLKRVLEGLGVKQAFEPQQADFSGIVSDAPLFVSQCIHEVLIEIDESGAKASSATLAGGTFGGPPPRRPTFYANHPFLFFIRHRPTGLILFMGRVVEPPGPVLERQRVDEPPKQPSGEARGGGVF